MCQQIYINWDPLTTSTMTASLLQLLMRSYEFISSSLSAHTNIICLRPTHFSATMEMC